MTAAFLESTLREASPDALVAYLTGGWPTPEAFLPLLRQVAAEADVVEIGVPFTDPMADGVTLQATSRQALAAGTTLVGLLDSLAQIELDTPLVIMSYLNPLLALGPELVVRLVAARISGVVIPDLPVEECEALDLELIQAGIGLIQLIAPTTPPARAARLAARARGFTYAVTALGVTGGNVEITSDLSERLGAIRQAAHAPVLAGFGIRGPDQVAALRPHADGVIVGSALMDFLTRGGDPAAFLRGLRAPARSVA